MKRYFKQGQAFAVGMMCAFLLLSGGCATGELIGYRATGTVTATVNQAMQAWADWEVQYPDPDVKARVTEMYGRYQEAALAARAAAIAYKKAPTDTAWQKLEAALGAVSAAAAEVIGETTRSKGSE